MPLMPLRSLILAASLLASPALAQVNDDAKAVLTESAKAITGSTGVEYNVTIRATGMLKDIIDLSGTVKIGRGIDGAAATMWIVSGRAKDPGKPDRKVTVSSDGTTVHWLDYTDNTLVSAPASDAKAMEMANLCREFLPPEWIASAPYTMELTQYPILTKTGITTIDGEVCDVVTAMPTTRDRDRTWAIGAKDHLPRSLTMGTGSQQVKISKITEMTGMKSARLTAADFEISLPFGFDRRPAPGTSTPKAAIPPAATTAPVSSPAPAAVSAPAAPAAPKNDVEFTDPTNAALLYYRAFMLLPDDIAHKIGELVSGDKPNWTPDAETIKDIQRVESVSGTLLRAAKIDSADFGVEYSQGIGALLPHLGKLRACSRFLAADSRRLIQDQKPDDAADRIVAIYAMSRHLRNEHLLISALVSNAIHVLAVKETDYLINSGQLTTAGRQKLLDALDRSNTPDAFGIKAAVRGERYWVSVWIRKQISGPDGARVLTEQILPLLDDQPDSEDAKLLKAMNPAAINADLDKCEPYYTAVIDAFDLPDAADRLAALEKQVKDGGFGIIAKHAAPAMSKAHKQYLAAIARQAEARARLAAASARPN